ncbi:MAG: molybdopterin biosynthesis protein [Bacteroidales bacterium]|nr:molybdopterin biosynthesis protein [Bacteroidales bacterium]
MSIYLHDIPLAEAKEHFKKALEKENLWKILGKERLALDEHAVGRVLAESVWAKISSPNYHASAMDGYALKAEETEGALPSKPTRLKLGEQASYVDTGDPIPDWTNAVIPIEQVEPIVKGKVDPDNRFPEFIRIRNAIAPWQHVRTMGEDIIATQLILPAGHTLRPIDLGAIAASGNTEVIVGINPSVAIIPTGTELIQIGDEIHKGDIIEFNSIMLAGQVKQWGGIPKRSAIIPDDFQQIKKQVQESANHHDLVLINAGSSAGSEDYSSMIVEELGDLLVHGIAVRPGHPVILGMINRCKDAEVQRKVPIIGIPGYPVSAVLTGELFVEPLLALWQGAQPEQVDEIEVKLSRKITSPPGDDDFVRAVAGKIGDELIAAPIARGAGVISSLVRADGLICIPSGEQGLEAGTKTKLKLYKKRAELERTIFAIGSHDMTLDILAQFLFRKNRRLVSSNVGSLGGLIALRKKEAHLAGTHLLDPETGKYNVAYLERYLPDEKIKLIGWVDRDQGLIVKKGNPKNIKSLADLVQNKTSFINRQRGSGTRVLLDYHLKQSDIQTNQICGYKDEEYTHLMVAAAVASDRVDCGLGIAAAAKALDLDFIPLFVENYDLAIPNSFFESELFLPLMDLLNSNTISDEISKLIGYNIKRMGQIVFEK